MSKKKKHPCRDAFIRGFDDASQEFYRLDTSRTPQEDKAYNAGWHLAFAAARLKEVEEVGRRAFAPDRVC